MENKNNISELLKDCPKGTKLYSPVCGDCTLCLVGDYIIEVIDTNVNHYHFYYDGTYVKSGECLLFPSKEQRDWSKFQRPFKDGDIITCSNGACTFTSIFKDKLTDTSFQQYCSVILDNNKFIGGILYYVDYANPRFATEEEKEKLFDAIKEHGYKWNKETKTLEKLPKFKNGDIVAFDTEKGAQLFIFKEYIHDHWYAKSAKCYMMLDCDGEIDFETGDYYVERLATKEEKEKLFKAIKDYGYKWNKETKTWK